jgi:autophagy-related protein 9
MARVNTTTYKLLPTAYDDVHYRECYEFYQEKGATTFICFRITSLLIDFFTMAVIAFTCLWVDWASLKTTCNNKETCNERSFLIENPLAKLDGWSAIISCSYFVAFAAYFAYNVLKFLVHDVWRIRRTRDFFSKQLRITPIELQGMSWEQVVEKMQTLEDPKNPPTPLNIDMRIMREDNIFIALVNKGSFDMRLDCICYDVYLGDILEFSLRYFVVSDVFTESSLCSMCRCSKTPMQMRQAWLDGSAAKTLSKNLRRWALLLTFTLPFIALFKIGYFVLTVAHEFHHKSTQNSLVACKWTPLAQWHFRLYNELPHKFYKRMSRSNKPGMQHLQQCRNSTLIVFFQCVAFVAGGIIGMIMIALYLVGDSILTINVMDLFGNELSILQLLTICGVLVSSARSYIPPPAGEMTASDADDKPYMVLNDIGKHTRFMPPKWQKWENTGGDLKKLKIISDAVCDHFKTPVWCFLNDFLSAMLTPVVLWFLIAPKAEDIVKTVRDQIARTDHFGDMCGQATGLPKAAMMEIGRAQGGGLAESWAVLPENESMADVAQSWNDPGYKLEMSFPPQKN